MTAHQAIIPVLVEDIKSYHDECAIVLIGSVANGTQRPDSDLDLNLFFPDEFAFGDSPYVESDNRWQLKILREVRGIRVDVAWETYGGLRERLQGDGPIKCWPFSNGTVLHDPAGAIGPCLSVARSWFRDHPEIETRIQAEYDKSREKKRQGRDDRHS